MDQFYKLVYSRNGGVITSLPRVTAQVCVKESDLHHYIQDNGRYKYQIESLTRVPKAEYDAWMRRVYGNQGLPPVSDRDMIDRIEYLTSEGYEFDGLLQTLMEDGFTRDYIAKVYLNHYYPETE